MFDQWRLVRLYWNLFIFIEEPIWVNYISSILLFLNRTSILHYILWFNIIDITGYLCNSLFKYLINTVRNISDLDTKKNESIVGMSNIIVSKHDWVPM